MNALFTLKSAKEVILILITFTLATPLVYPEVVLASSLQTDGQKNAQVFEIKNPSLIQNPVSVSNPTENQSSVTLDQVTQADPLVAKLEDYLSARNSPLQGSAASLVTYPKWERALAISFVESGICVHTPKLKTKHGWLESYNCSGIGGDNYKIYDSYLGWFADMNALLTKPNYADRPLKKFLGYYVVPGSNAWYNGATKTEADLSALEQQADSERLVAAASVHSGPITTALATFPEVTN